MINEQTFITEVQAMERTLYRVSRSYLPRSEDCADAVQEALLKAWRKRHTVDAAHFRPWLTRIVINECINVYRRRKRLVFVSDMPTEPAAPSGGDDALREGILSLPQRLRSPLILHYLEGFSIEEVARILRLPAGTVKSRLYQARKALKTELKEDMP